MRVKARRPFRILHSSLGKRRWLPGLRTTQWSWRIGDGYGIHFGGRIDKMNWKLGVKDGTELSRNCS